MEIVRSYNSLDRRLHSPVVAIGNFDGVHRGHAFIFDETRRLAATAEAGAEAVVLTFDPHPARVLAPSYAPPLITPLARKLELMEKAGLDAVVVQPFDAAFAAHSPDQFIDEIVNALR